MAEKTFTLVGTAIQPTGEYKMRWGNNLYQRVSTLIKCQCTEIEFHETPHPMTKLEAAEWLYNNPAIKLNAGQEEIVSFNIAEKEKIERRKKSKEKIINNINLKVKENAPTDPKVSKFIDRILSEA